MGRDLKNKISAIANATDKQYNGYKTIDRIFDDATEKYSSDTALIYGDEITTYGDFRNRVYSLGNYLNDCCGLKNSRVGVYMDRSTELLVALYAIMESGCAYVPLDPIYPPQRLSMIVNDSKLSVIITNIDDIPEELCGNCRIINIRAIADELEKYSPVKPKAVIKPTDPLYIMFTSGSTGRPKGVVITHEAVCNGFYWMNEYFDLQRGERELLKTSINFDVSVWELFWPTLIGGTLVILEPNAHKEPKLVIEAICKYNVSTIHFVPSMLQSFLENEHCEECTSLKRVICIGEALEKYQVNMFFEHFKNCDIFNLYGPTEATVHVSYHKCLPDEECTTYSIGLPISNTQLYVLDDDMNELDIGEMGELYIGGICLSPGYYNRPDLTEERFVDNPFSDEKGAKLYKTGDLASRSENGELDFYGRKDFQIKLHGFRIEIEEIEKWIKDQHFVEECVVTLAENKRTNDKKLAAYVVFHDGSADKQVVDTWKTIYDETYRSINDDSDAASSGFGNVWRSSYSGMAFGQEEFDELMESTVSRISLLSPKRILEIGCGNGFVLHRLAASAESYVGLDLSAVAIEKLKQSIEDKPYKAVTELFAAGADQLDILNGRKFDCIIINSVVQYFPTLKYFEKVISDSAELLDKKGMIYLGDLRNLDLSELFYTSVRAYRSTELNVKELKEAVKKDKLHEREFMISQNNIGYFLLQNKEFTGIQINKRVGKHENEMTKFRYDAVIFKGISQGSQSKPEIIDICGKAIDEEYLVSVTDGKDSVILKNVPDTMLIKDNYLFERIDSEREEVRISNIVDEAKDIDRKYMSLYEIISVLKKLGYYSYVCNTGGMMTEITACRDKYCFNASTSGMNISDISEIANVPADDMGDSERFDIIRNELKKKLPEYMIPSYFIKIKNFDYLPNGKLDRSKLSKSIDFCRNFNEEYAKAETQLQMKLTKLWEEVLGIDRVGIKDSFIELGGHSLLAIKMLSSVRRNYGADISLMDFFSDATIEHLAELIENSTEQEINEVLPEVERYQPFPLMPLQQSYYIGRQSDVVLGKVPTHIYCEIEFDNYDHVRFTSAVNKLIREEEVLRSRVSYDGTQHEVPFEEIKISSIDVEDYTLLSANELEVALAEKRKKLSYIVIDVTNDMPVYFAVTLLSNDRAVAYIYADCMYFDGWSFERMLNKLDKAYSGENIAKDDKSVTYQQYAEYYRSCHSGKKYEADKEYWLGRIDDLAEIPHIKLLTSPSEINEIRYMHKERRISEKMYSDLSAMAAGYNVSVFALLLTAYGYAISRMCRNKRFLINIPNAKRPEFMRNINDLLGECSDFFLYDYEFDPEISFIDAAAINQKKLWDMNDHSSFTGTDTVREIYRITGDRDNLSAPFVFTSLLDIPFEKYTSFRKRYYETHTSQVWMDVVAVRFNDEIQFNFESVNGLIEENIIETIADSFINCLKELVDGRTDIPKEELHSIPQINNSSELPDISLIRLLDDASEKYADRIAVKEYNKVYTYNEVFSNAKRLASFIKTNFNIFGRSAAVVLPRGRAVIECAIGILYAGGIYMPIDYEYPIKSICGCVENADAAVIITDAETAERLRGNIDIPVIISNIEKYDNAPVSDIPESSAESCICIIHTSGSTGKPKAIRLKQAALINCIISSKRIFDISEDDCAIAITNPCHDMSLYDIFGILPYGGSIAVLGADDIRDTSALVRSLRNSRATIWNSVPIFMEMLLETNEEELTEALSSLRVIIQGGDYFRPHTAQKLRELCNSRLFNVGGPSETTIWNIYHEVTDKNISDGLLPYGKPIDNTKYYILGDDKRPLADGVIGTMYVSGICVSGGYIGLDDLNAEKFVPDPFENEKVLMYNTGDLGYTDENGSIIFCGRADRQVKINGKRIELEGIENAALQAKGVHRSKSVLRNGNIILYCESSDADEKNIRETISEILPAYMIPAAICLLEHFPINSNGKICTSELPEVEIAMKHSKVSEDDDISRFLIEIFKDILGCDDIDGSDNFFALGGNSIKMIRMLALIRKEYNVALSIKDVFLNPYISDLHDMIKARRTVSQDDIYTDDYNKLSEYPVSVSQQGIWVSEMLSPVSTYTMNIYTRISGRIDEKLLKEAAYNVLSSYQALNVVFDMNDEGIPIQRYVSPEPENFIFNITELENENDAGSVLKELNHIIMDIQEGPLYQCTLIKISDDEMIFDFTCHHIVCDEQSFIMIMNSIFSCYDKMSEGRTFEISQKRTYTEYCVNSRKTQRSVEYWKERLNDEVLESVAFSSLSEDRQNRVFFEVPDKLYGSIKRYCSEKQTSEYMLLLTLMCKSISELSGREKFVVLSPYSDRINMGYEDTVGFFIKNTAIIYDGTVSDDIGILLEKTAETVLDSFENSSYPYEELISQLKLSHEYSDRRKRIVFNMIDSDRRGISGHGYTAMPFEYLKTDFENPTGLNIFMENINEKIVVNMLIHENYISVETATRLRDIFINNITTLNDM